MANLILPRRFTSQPQYPAAFDRNNPLVKRIIHYWQFDNGGIIRDLIGTANGTVTGAVPSASTPGRVLSYDGTNDYVNCGDISDIDFGSGDFSFGIRVFHNVVNTTQIYFGKDDSTAGRQFHFALNATGSTATIALVLNTTTVVTTSSSAVVSGQWYDVVVTRSGNNYTIYINGVSVATGSNTLAMTAEAAPLYLGARSYAGFLNSVNGLIESAWIANSALTSQEVRSLFDNKWQLFRRSPQVLYFDVGSGAQTLTPSLVTDSDTFHAATVTAGAVTLTPSLVTDGDTFHAATVSQSGTQNLTPALVSDGDTFYAATVTPGAVTLTPSLYTDADTFHAAEVAAGYNLQPPAFADSDAFHAATVTPGAASLTPALFVDGDTFYSPSVSGGAQSLTPALYTNSSEFYAATVTDLSWQVVSDASGSWSDVAANSDGWSIVANASGSWTVQ